MKNFISKPILFFASACLLTVLPSMLQADEGSKYSEVARERQYVGGKDESDLKTQAPSAVANKNKSVAEPVENNEGF